MIGNVAGMKQYLHHLQQDFTMMKDNMASELSVLEGTVPNTKVMENMERHMIDVQGWMQTREARNLLLTK
eukprot:994480-Prorocentrum_lima.AAC.1